MAYPFRKTEKLTQKNIISKIKTIFDNLPDSRSRTGNQKYGMSDAAMSAFSIFFMQSPSFLDHQKLMQNNKGMNNAESLFGAHQIPSDNQIRNLLDSVSPDCLKSLYWYFYDGLKENKKIDEFKVLGDRLLLAIDGVEYFSSQKIHCDCCSEKTLKNGKKNYSHTAVTPVIVSPNKSSVIPLSPEFVSPQDGSEKQDYELAASKRWIENESENLSDNIMILGDDLYCHQPFCEQIIKRNWDFLFVCKPQSHKTLYEWLDDFEREGCIETLEEIKWTGTQHLTYRYHWKNKVPLRDTDDALMVNWCEIEITNEKDDIIYKNSFATNYDLNSENIKEVIIAGRTRWKIENENNNTLKTKGYSFKHNFGHGKTHLSSLLASLIILAFYTHTLLDMFDKHYQLLRDYLPSRKTFFDDLRALTRYIKFDNWQELMIFMLKGLEIPIPIRV